MFPIIALVLSSFFGRVLFNDVESISINLVWPGNFLLFYLVGGTWPLKE